MAKNKKNASIDSKRRSNAGATWSFTGAFAVLGFGMGLLLHEVAAGIFIGLGLGLLVTTLLRYRAAQ